MGETARLSIKVPADIAADAKMIATARGVTLTKLVADAIALEKMLHDAKLEGYRFFVEDADGTRRRELILR